MGADGWVGRGRRALRAPDFSGQWIGKAIRVLEVLWKKTQATRNRVFTVSRECLGAYRSARQAAGLTSSLVQAEGASLRRSPHRWLERANALGLAFNERSALSGAKAPYPSRKVGI